MSKAVNRIMSFLLSFFMITIFIGCSSNNSKDTFSIEQFQSAMKAKNYSSKMKDVEKDFLPAARKRMIIGNEVLDIYLFNSNKSMESEAKHIDTGGCGYNNGIQKINVSWVAIPHFYKKGNIIVQYVGQNEKIISDLKEILGEQFAGGK